MRNRIFQEVLDETPKEVEIFVRLYGDLVQRIHELMEEKGISRKELAERMEKSPSEISKWLNGEHNFTLRSIAKLSAELGEPLLVVPKKRTGGAMQVRVHKVKHTAILHVSRHVTTKGRKEGRTVAETKEENKRKHAE